MTTVGIAALGALCLSLASCATECDRSPPPEPIGTIRGVLIELTEERSSFFEDDVHRASIDTGTEVISLEVSGRGDLLTVGEMYEVELRRSNTADPTSLFSFVLADDGCGGPARSSIWLVIDDELVDIEKPDRIRFPISAGTFFIGFGAFAVLVALFGRSRSE